MTSVVLYEYELAPIAHIYIRLSYAISEEIGTEILILHSAIVAGLLKY